MCFEDEGAVDVAMRLAGHGHFCAFSILFFPLLTVYVMKQVPVYASLGSGPYFPVVYK
jgi:hypothetical protein